MGVSMKKRSVKEYAALTFVISLLAVWPAHHDASPRLMYLGGAPKAGPLVSADGLKVLDDHFAWRRQ